MATPPDIPDGPEMAIVIGTRTHYQGWYHIDIDSSPLWDHAVNSSFPVDLVCDASTIPLPTGCAKIVYSTEALEHFPHRKTCDVVAEWARLLKPGAFIRIEAPDFIAACQQILSAEDMPDDEALDLHLRMQQIFFAEQGSPHDFHYAGITHRTLPYYMRLAGLEVIAVQRGWECGWLRADGVKL